MRMGLIGEALLVLADDGRPSKDRVRAVAELHLSHAELTEVGNRLSAAAVDALVQSGALVPDAQPSILSLTWPELRDEAFAYMRRGYALGWLCSETAGMWGPTMTLVDVLKIWPPDRVRKIAEELHLAGITDLDELLQPDEPDG